MRKIIVIASLIFISNFELNSQCNLLSTDHCSAPVLCGLDAINGITCNLVPGNGIKIYVTSLAWSDNFMYFAFISEGGDITAKVIPGPNSELLILGTKNANNLGCNNQIFDWNAYAKINPYTWTMNWSPCTIHYIGIGGLNGSLGSFTIEFEGKKNPPTPLSFGKINNDKDNIIELTGKFCPQLFNVETKGFNCKSEFIWTLDGNPIGTNDSKVELNFPDYGNYVVCISGREFSNMDDIECSTVSPVCATVKIIKENKRYGADRRLCENRLPYQFSEKLIFQEGTYEGYFRLGCIEVDSVVKFSIHKEVIPQYYHLSCSDDIFTDKYTGERFTDCVVNQIVKVEDPLLACDSSYSLTTSYPKINPYWIINNVNGKYTVDPNIKYANLCNAKLEKDQYQWELNESIKQIVSKEATLRFTKWQKYCLTYSNELSLGTAKSKCSFEYCLPQDGSLLANFTTDATSICPGSTVQFNDQSDPNADYWIWEIKGTRTVSSELKNPKFAFYKPGYYEVKLTVGNKNFTSSTTKSRFIKVRDLSHCLPKLSFKTDSLYKIELEERITNEISDFKIFPNPNHGEFTIQGLTPINESAEVELYDNTGRKVFFQLMTINNSSSIKVGTENVPGGVYFLKVNTSTSRFITRIVIK